jgi:sugar lactone lactonase YvrE
MDSKWPSGVRLPMFVLLLTVGIISGCKPIRPLRPLREIPAGPVTERKPRPDAVLVEVAHSDKRWTGIAVSREGRIFVCFPRWSDDVEVSVGEVAGSGDVVPFPDGDWNTWTASGAPGEHFICVQSVYMDKQNHLWILDAASPDLQGVVPGGAKLLEVDIGKGRVVRTILFDEAVAPQASYLNDVRVDTDRDVAYITDSGLGALVVVDLKTAKARRVLGDHYSTKAEDVVLKIDGREWRINGQAPRVHADGLALDGRGEFLYYQALTGRTLYRIATRYLRDPAVTGRDLAAHVEALYETCAADGMGVGPEGYLYLTSVEDNAIKLFESLGRLKTVVKDPSLKWPDSIAWGPDGSMYVTTSQIHLGADVRDPYRIFRITTED